MIVTGRFTERDENSKNVQAKKKKINISHCKEVDPFLAEITINLIVPKANPIHINITDIIDNHKYEFPLQNI